MDIVTAWEAEQLIYPHTKQSRRTIPMQKPQFIAVLLVVGAVALGSAQAETVVLRSGNGSIGGTDSQVNMLLGPADSAFASAFTQSDFTNARTGAGAFIISPHPAWSGGLPGDGVSQWISTSATGASEGGSALYAIGFTLTEAFGSATLDLHFKVDNGLGGGPNQGVYLNGSAISGNSSLGGFPGETIITRNDIASLLVLGTNTLYINATDTGGPAGLIFRAGIQTTPVVPEPGMTSLFGIGLAGLLASRRKSNPI